MKQRRALRISIWICLSVCLLICCWGLFRVITFQKLTELCAGAAEPYAGVCYRSIHENALFTDQTGSIYKIGAHCLRRLGAWHNQQITDYIHTTCVFPTEYGAAYIQDQTLFEWVDGERRAAADSVLTACWDGAGFVWLDADGSVFSRKEGKITELFHINSNHIGTPVMLLASEHWVVLSPTFGEDQLFQDLMIYHRQNETLRSCGLLMMGNDAAFLCEDTLIKIGGSTNTACMLDLNSMNMTNIETDITADQGTVTASAAYDKERSILYVSVFSKPELPWFYDVNTGTYAINLANGTAKKINTTYYLMLRLQENKLYGVEAHPWGWGISSPG